MAGESRTWHPVLGPGRSHTGPQAAVSFSLISVPWKTSQYQWARALNYRSKQTHCVCPTVLRGKAGWGSRSSLAEQE